MKNFVKIYLEMIINKIEIGIINIKQIVETQVMKY